MELINTRLNLQVLREDLEQQIYMYHVASENPEFYENGDIPLTVIETFAEAANVCETAEVFLKYLALLGEGTIDDQQYLTLLKDALAQIKPFHSNSTTESLNERCVREVLELEIQHLKEENAALKARADLLEEIPMVHPKIA